ncbi:hypothetical protein IV203_028694 [Nitzschia inconspicua]|uniref:Uncharacterized protein n=1 Tax=Nitzschia inconspicua TaxID=303405 RepID=A0A9K3LQE9_9STRA|nr:hypothetical protein IV203_028694 [Nitzschia inconspicua]
MIGHDDSGATGRKSHAVRFHELATVIFIDTWQSQNYADLLWYNDNDLIRFRRLQAKLMDCFNFYTDDELFDSFGLLSRRRISKRRERIRRIHFCVELMDQQGCKWRPEIRREGGLGAKLYDKECRGSAQDALERA